MPNLTSGCPRKHVYDRKYFVRVALINLLAATGAVGLSVWFGKIVGARDMGIAFVQGLIYAYSIGTIGALLLPFIAESVSEKPAWVKTTAVGSGIIAMTLVGCALAGGVLVLVGLSTARAVIDNYVWIVRFSIVIALAAGLGAFFFESLRHRLEETQLELRTRQLEEERAKKLATEARLSSLESRIHPHFLFNTLNSIASLIHEDPKAAEEIVGRLAALLRFSLDANQRSVVPLEQEMKIVRDYLEIEKARFGERLRYTIELPNELLTAETPPLAVESLVENSVKYAIAPRRGGGEVRISARAAAESIEIEVADSGDGFDLETVPRGHGIDNLLARLDALYGTNAGLDVVRTESGSAVRIYLPSALAEAARKA